MKKRLLFVDDEENILQGLKRMLRPFNNEWDIQFASSGEHALKLIQEGEKIDCIISDMRMPGMDGATLLTRVHKANPGVARFILSGHSELEPIMQAIPVTHQFLAKPCSSEKLVETVKRACDLHALISNTELIEVIGQVESLPARPEIYAALTRVIADKNSSMENIAAVIEKDVAITSKLLQVVNSAFFGLAQTISNVKDAVSYLGLSMVKSLALSEEVFRSFDIKKKFPNYPIDKEYDFCLLSATIAKKLLPEKRQADDAFMAAMLQKIGRLVIAQYIPEKFKLILADESKGESDTTQIEVTHIGASGAQIGAYLLGLWGLPYPIVEAVAFHNAPWEVEHKDFQILDAIYIANYLIREHQAKLASNPFATELNIEYLGKLGVDYALSEWREIANQVLNAEKKEGKK